MGDMTPERLAEIKARLENKYVCMHSTDKSIERELLAHIDAQAKRIEQLEKDKARLRGWLLHFMQFWEHFNRCDSYLGHQTPYNYEKAWHDCNNWITSDEYKSVDIFNEAQKRLGFVSTEHGLREAIDNAKGGE